MSSFQDLLAWRYALRLVKHVYSFTDDFPREERFILVAQMKRAAHSVHLNIAEGRGRLTNGEWQQFLGHSRGSLMELESAVASAVDLEFCSAEAAAALTAKIQRVAQLVNGLLRASTRGFAGKKFSRRETPDDGKP